MENILEVTNLSKFYGTKKVVNKLSFQIKEGEVLGILGANGAGKTTSIECILGTKKMDEGKALILGIEPKKNRKKIFEKVSVQDERILAVQRMQDFIEKIYIKKLHFWIYQKYLYFRLGIHTEYLKNTQAYQYQIIYENLGYQNLL